LEVLTKGCCPEAIGTEAGTNFSPQAIGTRHAQDLTGLIQSQSLRKPRAWCGAILSASLKLSAVHISPQAWYSTYLLVSLGPE
jgi:hypothetical protein